MVMGGGRRDGGIGDNDSDGYEGVGYGGNVW